MQMPLYLPQGHHELSGPVIDCEVDFPSAHPGDVVLTASIAGSQEKPMFPLQRGTTATTLAIRMDLQAAMTLHARLTELGRSTGWLQAEKA
jgi:hypothetical protein